MAIENRGIRSREFARYTLGAGLVGGLVAGIAMGIVLHIGADLMPFIGALVGWPTVLGGWITHVTYSGLLGLVFALLISRESIHDRMTTLGEWAISGVIYAAAIGLITSGVMLPLGLKVTDAAALPDPTLPLPGILGGLFAAFSIGAAHMVYGVTLGATYGRIHGRVTTNHNVTT